MKESKMNFEQARFNMIEQQIRPTNVLDADVLALLAAVKREDYFPEAQKSMAFFDTELPLLAGAHALTPKLEARILQEMACKDNESVLMIGAGNGYLPALFAHMARHVTVMEAQAELHALAKTNLAKNGVSNVDVQLGDALTASVKASYDVIVVSGSLEVLPTSLQEQLNVGGRLFVVLGQAPIMAAQVISRNADGFKTQTIFETSVQRLSQAVAATRFSF
jgi:protein-L-isoaspartate(D-aspartate) O-methyltransferase